MRNKGMSAEKKTHEGFPHASSLKVTQRKRKRDFCDGLQHGDPKPLSLSVRIKKQGDKKSEGWDVACDTPAQ